MGTENLDLQMTITHLNGRVYVYFTELIGQIDFSAKQAKEIATLLVKHAQVAESEEN